MTPATDPDRTARADRGWFVAAQVLLALLAVVYPQLGARESTSSILPPIRIPLEAASPALHTEESLSTDGDLDVDVDVELSATVLRVDRAGAAPVTPTLGASRDDEPTATGRPDSAASRAPPPPS